MRIRMDPVWNSPCGLPKRSLVFGHGKSGGNGWHYHILYLGLIVVFISWGSI